MALAIPREPSYTYPDAVALIGVLVYETMTHYLAIVSGLQGALVDE
jgi:hypothetical protein